MSEAKISEAAVEAARRALYFATSPEATEADYIKDSLDEQEDAEEVKLLVRAALEAALPHLHPQPAELAEQQVTRERFEAWAKSTGLETKIYAHNNMYSHPVTRGAWIAWESLASTKPVANDPVSYEYRFWNPDAKGGDGAWSGWGAIRKADYERELVEPVEGREVRALCVAKPDRAVDGYRRAFYELADMLDMGAQPISPKQAWETQMRPMLQAALAATGKQQVGEVQGDALAWIERIEQSIRIGNYTTASRELGEMKAALAARQPGAVE